jgi:integrase
LSKLLTDAAIRKYAPYPKRREISDSRAAGLHLIIQPSGAKSWALRFRRPDGRSAKLTLGPVDFSGKELKDNPVIGHPLTLAAARLLAADIHRKREMGRDVVGERAAEKRRERIETKEAGASTFGLLARQFIEEHAKPDTRRWRETARVLGLIYPVDGDGEPAETKDGLVQRWADRDVRKIDGHDLYGVVDEARRRGIPGIKPRTKGLSDPRGRSMARTLSVLFSWLAKHRKVPTDPTIGMYCPEPPVGRERVLSTDEVRWFWRACDQIGAPFGALCKLLLLIGVRREEARCMSRAELSDDGSTWIIPSARTKNHRQHVVPLSPLVRDVLAGMPQIESAAGYIFTINGRTPLAGIAKAKARLDAAMLAAARAERGKDVTIAPWRLHDLRRTAATGMADLGVQPHIIEAVLNHISGHKAGVAGIYNRSAYAEEKRTALERWAAHVEGIASDKAANVITLRKGA